MEENNVMNNQEEINENVEEVKEEVVEDVVEETVEETVEEATEEVVENEDTFDDEDYYESAYQKDPRKPLFITIAVMAVLILVLGGLLIWKSVPNRISFSGNASTLLEIYRTEHSKHEQLVENNEIGASVNTEKYNGLGYANVSGQTLGDIYAQNGFAEANIDFVMFLKMNNLPTDMTKDTYVEAALQTMPLYVVNLDVATLEKEFNIKTITTDSGDKIDITMDMPVGLVLDNMTVENIAKYYGAEDVDAFKAEYNLGDDVTKDTLWKEVRPKFEEANMKKAEEEAAKQEEPEEVVEDEATGDETAEAAPAPEAEATPAE